MPQPKFVPHDTLRLMDREVIPQVATPVPGRPGVYITSQARLRADKSEQGILSLVIHGQVVSRMFVEGHCLPLECEVDGDQIYAIVKWPTKPTQTYVRLPWQADVTWTQQAALARKIPYRKQTGPANDPWLQGRVTFGPSNGGPPTAETYRFHSAPQVDAGSAFHIPVLRKDAQGGPFGHILKIVNAKIVDRWDVRQYGLDKATKKPIDGQMEGEGLSLLHELDGSVWLVFGVATGKRGGYVLRMWKTQLGPATPMMATAVSSAFVSQIPVFEGTMTTMYLDTKGYVTTAQGRKIDTVEEAQALPWLLPDGTPATKRDIEGEWRAIKRRQDLRTASSKVWANVATLHISAETVKTTTRVELARKAKVLASLFPSWNSWPADAQLSMLDMAWHYGEHFTDTIHADGTLKWPNFRAAVLAQDWTRAAVECRSSTTGPARNEFRALGFRQAAFVAAAGLSRTTLWGTHEVKVLSNTRGALISVSAGKCAWALVNARTQSTNAFYLQRMLKLVGFYAGPLDGLAGAQTKRALTSYAAKRLIPVAKIDRALKLLAGETGVRIAVVK